VQTQSRQLQQQTDSVKSWPSKAKRWALIIGVDQYRDGQINALKGSVNDAHTLADALVRYAGFPQDQVIVLTTDQPDERQPTRINILTYLSNLVSLVPKDGLLLFSFAGHGIERDGQAYLIPSDARLSRDVSLLEESAVSVTRMHDRIKNIGVGQVIVFLDACRNDPGGRANAPNNMTAAYTKFNFDVRNHEVEAFATFYATAVGQRAYEYTEMKQGYFTWSIVEGLKGGAANEKGEITLAALVKYVQDSVPKHIAIDLGASEKQKPFATIEGYRADELVVAVAAPNPGKVSSSPSNTVNPTVGTVTISEAAKEQALWEAVKDSNEPQDFRDYLAKYPNGAYTSAAQIRLRRLEATKNAPSNGDSNPSNTRKQSSSETQTNPASTPGFGPEEDNTTFLEATTLRYFGTNYIGHCADACAANPHCKAYTFVKPGAYESNPNNGVCYLSSSFKRKVSHPCCISAVKGDPRTGGVGTSSNSVTGRWSGTWTNSRKEAGKSTININESGDGRITGDESGWTIENGRRSGRMLTWEYHNKSNGCRDYKVEFEISVDGITANGTYKAYDHCENQTYTGAYRIRRE
jgi:hypothetical protein